jgi:hypothetical protein
MIALFGAAGPRNHDQAIDRGAQTGRRIEARGKPFCRPKTTDKSDGRGRVDHTEILEIDESGPRKDYLVPGRGCRRRRSDVQGPGKDRPAWDWKSGDKAFKESNVLRRPLSRRGSGAAAGWLRERRLSIEI